MTISVTRDAALFVG